jgi:hypothetical protein
MPRTGRSFPFICGLGISHGETRGTINGKQVYAAGLDAERVAFFQNRPVNGGVCGRTVE